LPAANDQFDLGAIVERVERREVAFAGNAEDSVDAVVAESRDQRLGAAAGGRLCVQVRGSIA